MVVTERPSTGDWTWVLRALVVAVLAGHAIVALVLLHATGSTCTPPRSPTGDVPGPMAAAALRDLVALSLGAISATVSILFAGWFIVWFQLLR